MTVCGKPLRYAVRAFALACITSLGWSVVSSAADGNDRERAQLMQMQQQLQKLQADNASLQRERAQLQVQAKDAEALGKESAEKTRQISGAKKDIEKANRRVAELDAKLQEMQAQQSIAIETWKKAVEQRDQALVGAAELRRRLTGEVEALTARLKLQTQRGDSCEFRHVGLYRLSTEILDDYATKRMHWCEPVARLWEVKEQQTILDLKARLEALQLEEIITPPQEAAGSKDPAQAASADSKDPASTAPPGAKGEALPGAR